MNLLLIIILLIIITAIVLTIIYFTDKSEETKNSEKYENVDTDEKQIVSSGLLNEHNIAQTPIIENINSQQIVNEIAKNTHKRFQDKDESSSDNGENKAPEIDTDENKSIKEALNIPTFNVSGMFKTSSTQERVGKVPFFAEFGADLNKPHRGLGDVNRGKLEESKALQEKSQELGLFRRQSSMNNRIQPIQSRGSLALRHMGQNEFNDYVNSWNQNRQTSEAEIILKNIEKTQEKSSKTKNEESSDEKHDKKKKRSRN